MKDERYMSWFRQAVELGWACGLYRPQEILANILRNSADTFPIDEPWPSDHIKRFMIDTMQNELGLTERPKLERAILYFNHFYEDDRFDFGAYVKHAAQE